MGADQAVNPIRRPRSRYGRTAASILVGVLPIWALERWFDAPHKITVGHGILACVIGTTALKVPLHHFRVERVLRPHLGKYALSAIQGAVSASAKLAAAAAFLWWSGGVPFGVR